MDALPADTRVVAVKITAQLLQRRMFEPYLAHAVPAQVAETQLGHGVPDPAQGHLSRSQDAQDMAHTARIADIRAAHKFAYGV
jgi:hypothetical protein